MSMYVLDRGFVPLGSALAGALADAFTMSLALGVMGGICVSVVLFMSALQPRTRRL